MVRYLFVGKQETVIIQIVLVRLIFGEFYFAGGWFFQCNGYGLNNGTGFFECVGIVAFKVAVGSNELEERLAA